MPCPMEVDPPLADPPVPDPGSDAAFGERGPGVWGTGPPRAGPPPGRAQEEEGRSAQCSACLLWYLQDHCKYHVPEGMDPSHDWQGKDFDRYCWVCERQRTGEDGNPILYIKKLWVRECNLAKASKVDACHEMYHRRVRCVKYELAKKDIEEQHPGESNKAFRRRVLTATVAVAATVALAFFKADKRQREQYLRAMIRFDEDMNRKCEDPTFVPQLAEIYVSDFEAQFMSEVVKGMDEYFFCRHKSCMFVCRNTDWMHNAEHHPPLKDDPVYYRCPRCGQQYRPWKQQTNYCKANKMYVLEQQAAMYIEEFAVEKGSVLVYPIVWPDTVTTNMVNEFKQISAGMDDEIKAMDARTKARIIHHQVNTKPIKTYMQTYSVSPEAIKELSYLPVKPDRTWKYEHLQATGIQGWHATELADAEPLDLKDVVRMWGFAKYMLHQVDAATSKRVLKG